MPINSTPAVWNFMALDEWRQTAYHWSNEFRGKCQSYVCFLDILTQYSKFQVYKQLTHNISIWNLRDIAINTICKRLDIFHHYAQAYTSLWHMQLLYDGTYKDDFSHAQGLFQVYRSQLTY